MARVSFSVGFLVRSCVLIGMITGMYQLISAKQLTLFVHPRFEIIIIIAVYALVPLAIMQMLRIIEIHRQHEHRHSHTSPCHCGSHGKGSYAALPFIIILAIAVYVPNGTLDSSMAANKGLNAALASPAAAPGNDANLSRPLAAGLHQAPSIEVTDLSYTEIMSEINDFPEEYLEKPITLTGFVFRPPGATKQQFSLVRYVVVCCTADALPYGVLCNYEQAAAFPNDTWVSVKGIITKERFENKDVGAVKITAINKIEKPAKPYVFPYAE